MRIATWNLRVNSGKDLWPKLWRNLDLDLLFLQESASPSSSHHFQWEAVPGNTWGSAVIISSGTIEPVPVPDYEGWVVGGEVLESHLNTEGMRLFAFSLHSPSSSSLKKRSSYIKEVDTVVSHLETVLPTGCDVLIGGDFNFTVGERQPGEFQSTEEAERAVLKRMEALGLSSCWSMSHPGRPLEQTLRWVSDKAPHKSTPFHCDGIFVPHRWKDRVTCEVFTSECYRVSDHNPVVVWIKE
jgi:endonuclease/exonuclease/phosphatase family metal-dependent hydrolase